MTAASTIMQGSIFRPVFESAEVYVEHCEACWERGRPQWAPDTVPELVELQRRHPDRARRYIPTPDNLELMGLPRTFGQPVEPFDEEFRQRLYETIRGDDDFRAALRDLLLEDAA